MVDITVVFIQGGRYHLSALTNGLICFHSLRNVTKPVVWTLRDMWPMTGDVILHLSLNVRVTLLVVDYVLNYIVVISLIYPDLLCYKKRSLPCYLYLVGMSQWMSQCASRSYLFNGKSINTISNNIDTNLFHPFDSIQARRELKLPLDKKIILVGAQKLTAYHKGFDLFMQAILLLNRKDIHIVLFGDYRGLNLDQFPCTYSLLGKLDDDKSLTRVYSSADVYVSPPEWNFRQTPAEAIVRNSRCLF